MERGRIVETRPFASLGVRPDQSDQNLFYSCASFT